MMRPGIWQKGNVLKRAEINPDESIVAIFGKFNFEENDVFQVNDYMHQFGARDERLLAEARAEEERRALIEQQNREYAEAEKQDRLKFAQSDAAATIQRVARGNSARQKVTKMREKIKQNQTFGEKPQTKEELRAAHLKALGQK